MTFTKADQSNHRKAFIAECRQKAWGAACHAEWIVKQLDELLGHYAKLQSEDRELEANIEKNKSAIDFHTVENRDKRKGWQERRNQIAQEAKVIATNAQKGQEAMNALRQSAESSLQLAAYAEKWEWKEVEAK